MQVLQKLGIIKPGTKLDMKLDNIKLDKIIVITMLISLFVGVVLRFTYPCGFEFKEDEANALILANNAIKSYIVPVEGLISSLKFANPPFLIYLILPFTYVFSDPIFITYLFVLANIVAMFFTFYFVRRYFSKKASLYTLCFYSASTWAMVMSRKIWAQSLMPLFSIVVLFSAFLFIEKKRLYHAILAAIFASIAFGVHYSGAVIVILTLLCGYYVTKEYRKKYYWGLFIGYCFSAVLWYPYIVHLFFMIETNTFNAEGHGLTLFNLKAIGYPLAYVSNWSINDLLSVDGGIALRKFIGIPVFILFHIFSLVLVGLCGYSIYKSIQHKEVKYRLVLLSAVLPTMALLMMRNVSVHYFVVATPALFILMGVFVEFMSERVRLIAAVSTFILVVFNFVLLIFLSGADYFHGNFKTPIGRIYEVRNYIKQNIDCPVINYVDNEVPVYLIYILNRARYKCSDRNKERKKVYISYAIEGNGDNFNYANVTKLGPFKIGWSN